MYSPHPNQPQQWALSCEGAVALQFDKVMNVKYGNLVWLHNLFIEEKGVLVREDQAKAAVIHLGRFVFRWIVRVHSQQTGRRWLTVNTTHSLDALKCTERTLLNVAYLKQGPYRFLMHTFLWFFRCNFPEMLVLDLNLKNTKYYINKLNFPEFMTYFYCE